MVLLIAPCRLQDMFPFDLTGQTGWRWGIAMPTARKQTHNEHIINTTRT
jgi:hypothetical protein